MANVLSTEKRVQIISALVEGVSVRATARMCDVSKDTVMKLGVDLGKACAGYMDVTFRNLSCKRLQIDEIWNFVYAKAKNVPAEKKGTFGFGDVWTFTCIDADTKLMPAFLVGTRDAGCATEFMQDVASRLVNRVQLTTDGHKMYLNAVEDAFAGAVDFAQLVKVYGPTPTGDTRYSPPECLGCQKHAVTGDPDKKHVSTSYVERANLTIRMSVRRFTRLTNAFSKKVENHTAAIGLFHAHYNLCRIHKSLRVTPAMAAGVASRVWEIADLVALLPAAEPKKRGPYRKGEISK
ncbi:MAG TPA: IS1 family transposase [Thermoanaerobaculia bacterium]|jgi:IS1 family transposase